MFIEERFTTAEAEVAKLAKLTGTPFRKILDLGCGPGRHSIPLVRQGSQVTAVDRSPFLLEKARSRAELEKLAIEWVQDVSDPRPERHRGAFRSRAVLRPGTS
jgi:2-polyprenyl-3-methyl-5-hydroxy-6-metoxy-1,4-benzoquinol methylase